MFETLVVPGREVLVLCRCGNADAWLTIEGELESQAVK